MSYRSTPGIVNRVGRLMLPSKRPLYMRNILNVAQRLATLIAHLLYEAYCMAQILWHTLYSLQFMNQTITRRLKKSFEQIKPKHFLLSSTYPRKFREKIRFIQ